MHRLSSLSSYGAALALLAGCSLGSGAEHTKSSAGNAGELQIRLLAASSIDIAEVNYSIQVPEHSAIQGKLPVGDDGTVSGTVADVPAADGVLVALTAATSGGGVCSGEGTVKVTAGQTTPVSIVIQCRLPDGTPVTTGSIEITGTFNVCPQVLEAAANPASTETTAAVTSSATDLNMDTLKTTWSATSGSFADAAAANTTYTCAASGEQTLTITADDSKGCTHSKDVKVTCTAVTPPAPVCGDGKKEGAEACDDGNTTAGDGCSATCTTEVPAGPVCGDNKKEGAEECDDGNTAAGDGCSATCTTEVPAGPVCGDSKKEGDEQCDDGNTAAGDGCSATCTTEDIPTCEQPRPLANACAECTCSSCEAQVDACDHAEGNAAEGPAAGQSKAKLCRAVVACGQAAGCRGRTCFCGTADLIGCLTGSANGPCQAEILAAAETDDVVTLDSRQMDTKYAVGLSNAVSACSVSSCDSACAPPAGG